jgi:4-hydroxybenzoate polyprenyltransferase
MQTKRCYCIWSNLSEKCMDVYAIVIFNSSRSFNSVSLILFACFLIGIIVGGIMYSHPVFRFKNKPGIAMADMAVSFALESIGVWSIYSTINNDSFMVAVYVFVLVFSLTFMKDFKDVAGDINSLPILLGIRSAAKVCIALTILPLIPMAYIVTKYPYLAPSGCNLYRAYYGMHKNPDGKSGSRREPT